MLLRTSALVGIAALLIGQARAGTELAELNPVAVDTEFRSTSGSTRAAITFVNRLETPVDIYWIDYSGNRVFYQTLAPGERYLQLTFLTHPWLAVVGRTLGGIAEGTETRHAAFLPATVSDWDTEFDTAEIVQ